MEMDSHEERLHNMIQDSKREAAKEEAGRRAKELREKQKEAVSHNASLCVAPPPLPVFVIPNRVSTLM